MRPSAVPPLLLVALSLTFVDLINADGAGAQTAVEPKVQIVTKEARVERGNTVRVRIRCDSSPGLRCLGNLNLVSMRATAYFDEGIPLAAPRDFNLSAGRERVFRFHGDPWAKPKQGQRRRGYAFVKAKAHVLRLGGGADFVRKIKIHFPPSRR